MERLTNANHKEMGFFAYAGPKNPYSVPLTIGELAELPNIKYSPREILEEVFARLAAYEDTGLEPEEILDLVAMREITPEAEYAINKHADSLIERMDALIHKDDKELEKYRAIGDLSHLQELAQAEKDGRLVVLAEEKELTDEEIAEMTGYKCPICKHHYLCTMPGMRAMCGESYTHFEPRKPQEAEEALRKEADNG